MMLPSKDQVLVVDDEANIRRVLSAQLAREGYEVHTAEDGERALAILREHHIDLVITDLRMPKMDGMALLRHAIEIDPDLPVVMLTAHGTVDNAVEALKTGAFDYITKPFDQTELRAIVAKGLRTRNLANAELGLDARAHVEGAKFGIIGDSKPLQEMYSVIERVADTPTTVLITGESGTGKELVARALHENSSRRDKPFIKVNCAAIPKDLMESELFGYERGAFTGAVNAKPGRFELASTGTLFLDEIGEIPIEMQVKLLRVLQESEFERVGGIKTIQVDVRLVASTNRDLKKEIAAGAFREDLFYRLNVVPIELPSLRHRREDIPLLTQHFIQKFNERLNKSVAGVEKESLELLRQYSWPGNIRELENVIERAVLFCDGTNITPADLSPEVRETQTPSCPPVVSVSIEDAVLSSDGLKEQVRAARTRVERELIVRALEQTAYNVTHAARILKISRKGLQLKMKELGLRDREEKPDA
ncbi:MAG TPA: sigma-54 dependent transcriptional regulator [Polyangiaceae bacterium]|jgi:nitrogen regulation protein NR(I)|nr:sigma-54 dependent transcriptional regulator [Polyangiaceae bacterium]HNZ22563.1 sigma-54 dependent transcriptional regulator [Polyangiaceae bacterium]HOD23644.1 sigma-54 dependent transcriptional regulator [Polyangiaceae bacterium]HOE50090.1 sigma-54 dependent transcriptional regulator [Polyangiaceae bacterium]HOH00132.1 sigma-54 dependent transcriptional regulator [Polyangiaceae bacterium]